MTYLGTSYISPHKGIQSESEKIKNLAEDIINLKRKGGDIILQGDFNARTSNDCIEPDKYDIKIEKDQLEIPQKLD